jgi:transcriptional antiterminator NusG
VKAGKMRAVARQAGKFCEQRVNFNLGGRHRSCLWPFVVAGTTSAADCLCAGNARRIKKMLVADVGRIKGLDGASCDLHRFARRIHFHFRFGFSSYFFVSMRNQWFIIQTLSGQENKVKDSIEKRVKTDEMQDFVKEVLVPMEKVVEVRNQKKTVSSRKLWPGYVFVDMVLLDENGRIIEKPWYFIKETQGVIGFVGGEPPVPTPTEEVEQIKSQISQSEETEKPKVNFEVGETIKINNGPFLNFSGVIEEIDPERGKLKVTVNIFGRNTPVELEYWQVEKA